MMRHHSRRMPILSAVLSMALSLAALLGAAAGIAVILSSCDLVPPEEAPHDNPNDPDGADYTGPVLPVAVLTGLPAAETYARSISVTVGGTGITSYVYSLDGGDYSEDTPVSTLITATELETGAHTLSVLGKDADGWLQWESRMTTHSWTILEQTDFTPPDAVDIDAFTAGWFVASAPSAALTLSWSDPAEYVLVVRSQSGILDTLPTDGTAYAAGDTIGSCEVVYVGADSGMEETTFVSDGVWYYRAFAFDEFFNYNRLGTPRSILVYKDAVYVHYQGTADAAGTSSAPLRTIQAGIAKAVDLGGLYEVRVAGAEDYLANGYGSADTTNHVVTMASGVSIYGGYDPTDWSETARDPDTWVSWIGYSADYILGTGNCITVAAENLNAAVTIDGFTIDGVTADGNAGELISVWVDSCTAPVRVSDCVITGGEVDTAGTSFAVRLNNCDGNTTISECGITGGLNAAGDTTCGIYITDAPAIIENNDRIWGGTTPGGSAYGICASGSAAVLTISGNDNGIDCIANASGQSGSCYGIYLEYCGETLIENSAIMACADGTTAENPCALAIRYTDATVRSSRLESRASGMATTSYCVYLNATEAYTVTINNCHILATGAVGGTTSADVYGIYTSICNFSLYNNNIGAGPGGSTNGRSCALYMGGFNDPTTAVANNNIYCVAGAQYDYGIFEGGNGSLDYFRTNNFIDCADALYYNADTSEYILSTIDLNSLGPGNINDNSTTFNEDGLATAGYDNLKEAGTDGAAQEPAWPFTTDKDGLVRTGNGTTGWSIGPYEFD